MPTLTLNQANAACKFQESMDTYHANVFARALPHDGSPLDLDAIYEFEQYARKYELREALCFLHQAILPVIVPTTPSILEQKLCG
jgi:hypothetical protein